MRLTLSQGDMVLELDPSAGGAISQYRHRELDILRPSPVRIGPAFDPRKYAAFPMVPFVGRIHNGRFQCDETLIELHPNMPPEPHAIHGHGWHGAWKVESAAAETATLGYAHSSGAWPWDYFARQVFRLTETGLFMTLSVTNKGDTRMPSGLGWHPYFPRADATLIVPTTHEWTPDEVTGENLPRDIQAAADLSSGKAVQNLRLDTTFSVGSEAIEMSWPTHSITMISDDIFRHATIYVPPDQDYFCAEPVSHAPNAVNSSLPPQETGFRWLAPGEALSGSIELIVKH